MKTYTQRPKTPAGRVAWDAFRAAMGAEPKEISYGHGTEYGWCWTSQAANGAIWVYSASWAKAHCAYAPQTVSVFDMHRAGDAIDRMQDAQIREAYSPKS